MSADPIQSGSDEPSGRYDLIHLGGQIAVVLPLVDYLKLQVLEQRASVEQLEDAEDIAVLREVQARRAAGRTRDVSIEEARRTLGLDR